MYSIFTPLPTRTIYASTLSGIHQNSNVTTGGGSDDTVALQAALNSAPSLGRIELILDGPSLTTGLNASANTRIRSLDRECGLFLATNSNRPILRNKNPTTGTPTDANIAIDGGTFNCNAANQSGTLLAGEGDFFIQGMGWYGVSNLTVTNLLLSNAYQYAFANSNITGNLVYEKVEIQNGLGSGRDGIHIFGGCAARIYIVGCHGQTGSDFVALNGTDYVGSSAPWVLTSGTLNNDILVRDTRLEASANGVGILGASFITGKVWVDGLHGTCREYALSLWNNWGSGFTSGKVGQVRVMNITATNSTDTPLGTYPSIVCIYNQNFSSTNRVDHLKIEGSMIGNTDNRPWLYIDNSTSFGLIELSNLSSYESPINSSPGPMVQNLGVGQAMTFNGVNWLRPSTSAAGHVLLNSGTISNLTANHFTEANVSGFLSNSGTITNQLGDVF